MPKRKNCSSQHYMKNAIVRVKQRYLCKECRYNFVEDDKRRMEKLLQKKQCAHSFILSGQDILGEKGLTIGWHIFLIHAPCLSVDTRAGANVSATTDDPLQLCLEKSQKWPLMRCGILLVIKKQTLGYQGKC